MKAFVLAAGYATRLWPLTRNAPKPLLEVAGSPILTHLLRRITTIPELSEVVVIGNHRFADNFRAWSEAVDLPVPLRVLDDGSTNDDDKLGAVGDLGFALEQVPPGDEDWLVIAGDNLLGFDLAPYWERYREHGEPMLLLREVIRGGGPSAYNEVTLAGDDRVARFREKPEDPVTDLAAIALYFFPPAVAGLLRRYLAEGHNPDAPGYFIAWLVEQIPVRGVRYAGSWHDIGNLETLQKARENWPGPGPPDPTGG